MPKDGNKGGNKVARLATGALALALLPACEQKASTPDSAAPAAKVATATGAAAEATASPAAAGLPVKEDFEDSAEREIDGDSLDEALAELERDIASDSDN